MKDLTPTRDKAVTTGLIGDGFYSENSAPQMAAIEHVLPWLEDAARDLPLGDSEAAVGLADIGCSEGRNSIAVMRRLVPAVRADTTRPIRTIHSDLPTNDFFRAFTEPLVRSQFAGHAALDTLIDDIYERAENLLREHPERYPFRYIAVAVLMTRLDH